MISRRALLLSPALLAFRQGDPDVEVLQALLRVEHAAVHGYGLVGARLAPPLRDLARRHADVHKLHRDLLRAAVRSRGAEPVAAEPAYAAPAPPNGPAAARTAAQGVERAALLAYHAALPRLSHPADRGLVAQMLVRAAEQSVALGAAPELFPGRRR